MTTTITPTVKEEVEKKCKIEKLEQMTLLERKPQKL